MCVHIFLVVCGVCFVSLHPYLLPRCCWCCVLFVLVLNAFFDSALALSPISIYLHQKIFPVMLAIVFQISFLWRILILFYAWFPFWVDECLNSARHLLSIILPSCFVLACLFTYQVCDSLYCMSCTLQALFFLCVTSYLTHWFVCTALSGPI